MASYEEGTETQLLHLLDLVLRHALERVVPVTVLPGRFGAVAVASEVRSNHSEIVCQSWCDAVSASVRERVAVQ